MRAVICSWPHLGAFIFLKVVFLHGHSPEGAPSNSFLTSLTVAFAILGALVFQSQTSQP